MVKDKKSLRQLEEYAKKRAREKDCELYLQFVFFSLDEIVTALKNGKTPN